MSAAVTLGYEKTEILTARRNHRCWSWATHTKAPGDGWDDEPTCARIIASGETYVRSTVYPGHDSGYAGYRGEPDARPVSSAFCMACANRWLNIRRGLDAIEAAS